MTGIEFMVRDLSGWTPPIQFPVNRHPEFAPPPLPEPGDPLSVDQIEYIKDMAGVISASDMATLMGVSHGTVQNIRAGIRTGRSTISRGGKRSA